MKGGNGLFTSNINSTLGFCNGHLLAQQNWAENNSRGHDFFKMNQDDCKEYRSKAEVHFLISGINSNPKNMFGTLLGGIFLILQNLRTLMSPHDDQRS